MRRSSGGYGAGAGPLRFRVTVSGELAEYLSGLEPGVRSREVAFLALAGKRVLERGAELAAGGRGRAMSGEAKADKSSAEPELSAGLDWMNDLKF